MLDVMRQVFDLEIDTLNKARDGVNESYIEALEKLFGCTGKVVVTGMGKSGLIAQKIAGTMVSTGTAAIFLHPSDGMHGNVGIVLTGDVVLSLTKSGETQELIDLSVYFKRVNVPVICITANPDSSLGKTADVVIFTPVDKEAGPLNLAPTSSTTAALVVGDALAMALMNMRGFDSEQFAQLHPGGQLGKRLLMEIVDVMRSGKDNPAVGLDGTTREMFSELTRKRTGAVSVIDEKGQLMGLITDYDIRTALEKGFDVFSMTNGEVMNPNVTSIFSDEKAVTALELMENRDKPFLVLPVLDRTSGAVVGMVHLHDLVSRGL